EDRRFDADDRRQPAELIELDGSDLRRATLARPHLGSAAPNEPIPRRLQHQDLARATGRTSSPVGYLETSTTLADFSRARDSQITFSVAHGWSAFWRGRPWLAGRRIGETSSDVGSSRFWIRLGRTRGSGSP